MFSAKIFKKDYKLGRLTAHVYDCLHLHLGGQLLLIMFVYTSYCLDNYLMKVTKPYNSRKWRGTRILAYLEIMVHCISSQGINKKKISEKRCNSIILEQLEHQSKINYFSVYLLIHKDLKMWNGKIYLELHVKTKQFLLKTLLKIQKPHQSDLSKRERKKKGGIIKAFLC